MLQQLSRHLTTRLGLPVHPVGPERLGAAAAATAAANAAVGPDLAAGILVRAEDIEIWLQRGQVPEWNSVTQNIA